MADRQGGFPGSPDSSIYSDNESGGRQEQSAREHDRFLPIANVGRIMKKALPANAKISKDAKETMQECVSEFISFITGEASDKCQREKRKTVNGEDLLWGMATLGFEDYMEPLKVYLHKYREMYGEKTTITSKEVCNVTGGGAESLQMMQQTKPYHQVPVNLHYGQQMVMPYQLINGSGSGSGSGSGNGTGAGGGAFDHLH